MGRYYGYVDQCAYDINTRSASVVTTASVVEQDGKRLSMAEHSQRYPLEVRNEI